MPKERRHDFLSIYLASALTAFYLSAYLEDDDHKHHRAGEEGDHIQYHDVLRCVAGTVVVVITCYASRTGGKAAAFILSGPLMFIVVVVVGLEPGFAGVISDR